MELMAGVLIGVTVLIVWPLTRKPRFIALPLFLSLGSLALLSLVDHSIEKQIFIFLISSVYYITLLGGYRLRFYVSDQTALGMVNLATLSTVFLWFTAALGFYLNFHVQYWVMVVFVVTIIFISLPSFYTNAQDFHNRIYKDKKNKIEPKFIGVIFLSLILALIMSQLLWGILFWPFGYLTLGGSALIIFYEFWDVIRLHLRGELTLKRMVVNFVVGVTLLTAILLTAQWDLIPKI
jgi:hypothetical protein